MKNFLFTFLFVSGMVAGVSAETKVTVTPIGENPMQNGNTPAKIVSTADVLVNENFEGFVDGSEDEPDYDNQLASYYSDERIDTDMTHGDQWRGSKVYSAGGMCALRTFNPSDLAYIQTPNMDYSGSVRLTFRAKYLLAEWEEEDGKKYHWPNSVAFVRLVSDSDREFNTSEKDLLAQVNIYPAHGWCEVCVDFDNYSAYNDASILLSSSTGLLIDDVKVTSSADKFIASPVITGLSDVTETSFTVNFEPVRKAGNYYGFLFSLEGYGENGEPIYQYTFPEGMIAELESMGMSVDDYVESMKGYEPYLMTEMTDKQSETSITFTDLNPEKEYYYAIASHYIHTFSDYLNAVNPVNVLPTPVLPGAIDIAKDAFTAVWNPVTKADSYIVSLFGVNQATEDEDNFIIFEEDFSNTTAFTSSSDNSNPEWIGSENGVTLSDLTSTPGWTSSEDSWPLVEDKFGLKWMGAWVATPSLYLASDDKIKLSLRVEANSWAESFIVRFAGERYDIMLDNGIFEDEIELPTNGMANAPIQIACADDYTMYIDYIMVTQSLKKGDYTYLCMDVQEVESPANSFTFDNLTDERFDFYGYSVMAQRGEGYSRIYSEESERMIIDLENGISSSGVCGIMTEGISVHEVARYSIDGKLLSAPAKGMNIIRFSDGSVKKVMVK